MKQSEAFLCGEGEAWLKRNIDKLRPKNDPVLDAMERFLIQPKRLLEVGCANGWRLAEIERQYGCEVEGVDPCYESLRGASEATVWAGTADKLSQVCGDFDVVIYGWCLYLCDPEDYFKIAYEGDIVLNDGGHLIIYDFLADHSYKTPYQHKNGLFSYHYDFAKLWRGHPAYSLYGRTIQGETSVTILKKDLKNAFKERP